MAVPEIEQEQGNASEPVRNFREQNEDAIVGNMTAHNYTGVVTSACSIKARGEALSYTSILSEMAASGGHTNMRTSLGIVSNLNDIPADNIRDCEADRAVSMMIHQGYTGVLECATSLHIRGIDVLTTTLHAELWISGRLQ